MIDMVFLLLIFFMLTTSFVRDEGLTILFPTPKADAAMVPDTASLLVVVQPDDTVALPQNAQFPTRALPAQLRRWFVDMPNGEVQLAAASGVNVQQLVAVMDIIRQAGGSRVVLVPSPLKKE